MNPGDLNDGEAAVAATTAERPRPAGGGWPRDPLAALHQLELQFVDMMRRAATQQPLRGLARATNWLGNGWLYGALAIVLLFVGSRRAIGVLLAAGLGIAAAHAVYPWIKRRVARLRPFERVLHWQPDIPVLDRYSFPSGHCMTATAAAIPLAQGYPQLLWPVLAAWALIAWARMACTHHYPSDVVAGWALGATMAFGASGLLQQLGLT